MKIKESIKNLKLGRVTPPSHVEVKPLSSGDFLMGGGIGLSAFMASMLIPYGAYLVAMTSSVAIYTGLAITRPQREGCLLFPYEEEPVDTSWELPVVEILAHHKINGSPIAATLVKALPGKVIDIYFLSFPLGFDSNKIPKIDRDLRLPRGHKVNVIDNAGDGLVAIEVPAKERETVHYVDLIQSSQWERFVKKSELPMLLGEAPDKSLMTIDLTDVNHLFIAGSTRSGKSALANVMLLSLMNYVSPEDLKIVLSDPKRLGFLPYLDSDHLKNPFGLLFEDREIERPEEFEVFTRPPLYNDITFEATKTLELTNWIIEEMEERYAILANANVDKLSEYNKLKGVKKMPFIVAFFDEAADSVLDMTEILSYDNDGKVVDKKVAGKEIHKGFIKLAQKAAASGIFIGLLTQRPDGETFSGLLRTNLSRIGLTVPNAASSRIAIDDTGCEKLRGNGDFYLKPIGVDEPERGHGAFLDGSLIKGEVQKINQKWRAKTEVS